MGQTRMDPASLEVGATYYVCLEQDWVTCVLKEIGDKYVTVDYCGRLHRYGVPVHVESVEKDHFLLAWEPAPHGHWSRMYDEDQVEGLAKALCEADDHSWESLIGDWHTCIRQNHYKDLAKVALRWLHK